MTIGIAAANWVSIAPTMLAAFLASLVEFVEALTVILAVGAVRAWRPALVGAAIGVGILAVLVIVLGPLLTRIPLDTVQLVIGTLLLLFGLRWLRKAILRSAGVIPLHDEAAAFEAEKDALRAAGGCKPGWDKLAVATALQITLLEGIEVVFIVIAMGAGGGMLLPAALAAGVAFALVCLLGLLLHRPLASIPENLLKFTVGILLTAFGTFWVGEGLGIAWPGSDWSIGGLVLLFLTTAVAGRALARSLRTSSVAERSQAARLTGDA
ncbi:MAG: hypothetical protein ABI196_03615 [Bradyrhizobium sp.]